MISTRCRKGVAAGSALLAALAVGLPGAPAGAQVESEVPSQSGGEVPTAVRTVPLGELPQGVDSNGVDLSASSSPAPLSAPMTRGAISARAAGDSMFPPRGGSLIPPSSGRLVCFRYGSSGSYWCRYMEGIERLGDRRDFVVGNSSVYKRSGWHSTFGRALQLTNGHYYEGCVVRDSSSYRCDFRSLRRMSTISSSHTSGWELRVLTQWSSYQAKTTAPCAATIVGVWVGAKTPTDVVNSCGGAGPYQGYRP